MCFDAFEPRESYFWGNTSILCKIKSTVWSQTIFLHVEEGFFKPIQESYVEKQAYCNENKCVPMLLSQGRATFDDKQAFCAKLSMLVQAADSKANLRVPFGHKQSFRWI